MLCVNFLKEDEIREPAEKLLRTTGFALCGGIVAGIVLYILLVFMQVQSASTALENAKRAEASLQNSYRDALRLRDTNKRLVQMKNELIAFTNAQMKVADRLYALADAVPDTVQLINLEINSDTRNVQPKNQKLPQYAARRYYGTIQGRVAAETGAADFKKFIGNLKGLPEDRLFGRVREGGFNPERVNNKKGGMPDYILTVELDAEPKSYTYNGVAEGVRK